MNQDYVKSLLLILLSLSLNYLSYSQCFNGGLEDGSFTGWHGYTSINNTGGINTQNPTLGFVSSRHDIMTTGYDPVLGGITLRTVLSGNYSLRLGSNSSPGYGSQTASDTFTVSDASLISLLITA